MPRRPGHVPGAAPGGGSSAEAASSPRPPPAAGAPSPSLAGTPRSGAPLSPAAGCRPSPAPLLPLSAGGQRPWRAEADGAPRHRRAPRAKLFKRASKGRGRSRSRGAGGSRRGWVVPPRPLSGWLSPPLNPSALRCGSGRPGSPCLYRGAAGSSAQTHFSLRGGGRGKGGGPLGSSRRPLALAAGEGGSPTYGRLQRGAGGAEGKETPGRRLRGGLPGTRQGRGGPGRTRCRSPWC